MCWPPQVFLDVLPVCKFGLCCTNSPENPKLEATVQILSLVSVHAVWNCLQL